MPEAVLRALAIAFLPSAVFAWPIYRILLAAKARQNVSKHLAEHAHKQGTPTMGGFIILAGLLTYASTLAFQADSGKRLLGIPVLIFLYATIGYVDDYVVPRLVKGSRGLTWTHKLLMQIGFAVLAVLLLQPASTGAMVFGVVAILFVSNAFNFTDGLDWLASTVLVGMAAGTAVLGQVTGMPTVVLLAAAMVAATLPFMVLNRPPAKIFMGDVGSMPLGGLFGVLFAAIAWPGVAPALSQASEDALGPRPWPVWVALTILGLVMAIELLPVPIQIASVKLRGKRVFPMTPIHHAYQRAGWKETKIVALFFGVQVLCSLVAAGMALGAFPAEAAPGTRWVK